MTASWRILVLILAVQTVANIGPMGLPAIAPLIREDLDLSLTQAGSFLSAYYVGPILMSLPAGWLADRWGIRRTMVAGQVLIAFGLLSAAFARSFAVLVPLTILAGVGYGMLNPTSTKAVIAWFPQRQRATAVGLKQTGLPFGGVLGAALLPALGLALGWRAAVMASAASILVLGAVTLVLYRDPPDLLRPSGGGGSGMIRTVLGTADLWWVSLATLIFAVLQTVWLSFLVLYLHEVVRLSVVSAAGYLAQAQVTGILGRIVFGVLSDRLFGAARRGHGRRPRARGLLARRHARAARLRLGRRAGRGVRRRLDRSRRHHGGSPGPPRASARGAPPLRQVSGTAGRGVSARVFR